MLQLDVIFWKPQASDRSKRQEMSTEPFASLQEGTCRTNKKFLQIRLVTNLDLETSHWFWVSSREKKVHRLVVLHCVFSSQVIEDVEYVFVNTKEDEAADNNMFDRNKRRISLRIIMNHSWKSKNRLMFPSWFSKMKNENQFDWQCRTLFDKKSHIHLPYRWIQLKQNLAAKSSYLYFHKYFHIPFRKFLRWNLKGHSWKGTGTPSSKRKAFGATFEGRSYVRWCATAREHRVEVSKKGHLFFGVKKHHCPHLLET